MSLLDDSHHLARLRRRHRHACVPTSNTASHDQHEKINSWVSFSFLYEYGAPLGGPSGHRSSTKKSNDSTVFLFILHPFFPCKQRHLK